MENDRLRVATIDYGTIHFQFGDEPIDESLPQEEKDRIANDNANRAKVKNAIAKAAQLDKFVNYMGENPNNAFNRFAGELPGNPNKP